MRTAYRLFSLMAAVSLLSATAAAQNATPTPPARETPRPQDLEPGVDTSSPAQSPDSPASKPATGVAESQAGALSSPNTASGDNSQSAAGANPAAGASPAGASAARAASPAAGANAAPGTAKPAAKGKGQDRLELDTTQITGNRELPKVLYIVPWKRSDLGDLVGRPVNSLLDEVLTPVDRDVFQRENRYYRALTPGAAENDARSAPDSKAPTNGAPAAGSQGSAARSTTGSGSTQVPTGSGSAASPPRDEK